MKRWIAMMVVMLAVASVAARADDASKQAKVRELFVTMRMEHMLDQMLTSIQRQVVAVAQMSPDVDKMTPEQKKLTQNFVNQSMKIVSDSVGWTSLEPEYVKLYAATYSEEEIDGILAFYKSPVGQKMLEMTPQLSAGGMDIVQKRMGDFQPKIKELQAEYLKQMAATVAAPTAPPKP
jgi:hypothetical protein